jgi:formylglycine-generating enzyme required for sulfatase activity
MKAKLWTVLAIVVIFSLGLASCGPTPTPVPPTDTPVPPTDTPVPPTDTPVPPTDTPTPVPPTDTPTPVPPTDTTTPVPPTDTPVPPTDTPTPVPTPLPPTPTATPTPVRPPAVAEAGQVWVNPIDGAEMVYVPAGEFVMGSDRSKTEQPVHTVYLDAFWIDRTEVTNAGYRKCVEVGTCSQPRDTGWYNDPNRAEHPVVWVDWYQAKTYCEWAGKRLPTEAEWEKAARGTDGRTFPWGEGIDCDHAHYSGCPWTFGETAPVGSKPAGASPYGALDMTGNVWEWVADWYDPDYYSQSPDRNPPGPASGETRVLRGCSWNSRGPITWRFADWSHPTSAGNDAGFRCVQQ